MGEKVVALALDQLERDYDVKFKVIFDAIRQQWRCSLRMPRFFG